MSRRVQAGTNRWRNEKRQELEIQLRELADAEGRVQIERWSNNTNRKSDWTLYNAAQLSLEAR
jgi:hypothetical protein